MGFLSKQSGNFNCSRHSIAEGWLQELHHPCTEIFPIFSQVQFRVLVLKFMVLNNIGPGFLKDHHLLYCPAHWLRSTSQALFSYLPSKVRLVATRERTFSVVLPHLCNTHLLSLAWHLPQCLLGTRTKYPPPPSL